MTDQEFYSVWYLPAENTWSDWNLLAYKDFGKLTVKEDSAEFEGHKYKVIIKNIKRISFGKQGRDFMNNWVKVEYGKSPESTIAFFADGRWLGWGGIFGGTRRIYSAIKRLGR